MSGRTKHYFWLWLITSISLSLLMTVGFFRSLQDGLIDKLFTRHSAPDNLIIVDIDEDSISTIGQWPWPRANFAQLIERLQTATVIGIDVNFKERSRLGTADDNAFSDALSNSHVPVVLTADMQPDGSLSLPLIEFSNYSLTGFPNILIADDGVARNIRYVKNGNQSFALKISEEFYRREKGQDIPLIPSDQTKIYYSGPDRTYQHISARSLFNNKVSPETFTNKIVLIGATARDLQDYHLTPFNLTSGVEIQANIIETLLGQKFFSQDKAISVVSIFLLSAITFLLAIYITRLRYTFLAILVLIVTYTVGAFISFDHYKVLDILYPDATVLITLAVAVIYRYLSTTQEKKFIQDSFSRYLAPQVIEEIIKDPKKLALGGKKANLTILFSDIRSFTTLSEGMTPENLTNFLNRYLTRMTDIVLDQRGVVDKYIGDAIMAFWGAPMANPNHAYDAVIAALNMVDGLAEFNEENKKSDQPTIEIGIGLNSGDVTVGNMGSTKRFDYTVMGDNVNLASRLEGLTKTYGVNILISETTAKLLFNDGKIVTRELDQVNVKGKTQAVKIFEVVPKHKQEKVLNINERFTQARQNYYYGNWDKAISMFDEILKYENDKPSQLLRERCLELKNSPPEKWQGVYTLTHK